MSSSKILCLLVIIHACLAIFASAQALPQGDVIIRVPLYNQNNTFYYGEMQIGTPPQSFKVMFDNFAFGIAVPSTSCTNDICQPHARYDPGQSSTYVDDFASISLGYSTGLDYSCSGTTANDTITLGGIEIPNVSFLDVSDYTGEDFKDAPFDVIFGLQFADPIFITHPFYADLRELGQLDPIFSVSLSSELGDSGSFFMLGGYDTSKAPRGFDYYDVLQESGIWRIQAEDFGLGNTSYANGTNGTIYLGINMALESTYGGAGPIQNIISDLGVLDCTHILNYPDFYVTIQGTKYLLPPSNYIFGSEEGCELGLKPEIIFADSVLQLGNHFIKSHYTVFDFGANQIGIAKPAPHQEMLEILQ